MSQKSTPRRQPRSAQTRRRILTAAEQRFAGQGYADTRLEDIGNDAGVVRSAVLYHFADKQTLYRAVLDDLFGEVQDVLQRSLAGAGELPARIENAVAAAVSWTVQRPASARIAMRHAADTEPAMRQEIQRRAAPILDLIRLLFEEGERAGLLRPRHPDPLRFVSVIAGTALFYVTALPNLVPGLSDEHLSPESTQTLQRDLLDVTRRLLGIRGPRPLRNLQEKT